MYTNKAEYDKAYRDLTAELVAPYIAKRNQLDSQRFPDIFPGASQPPAPSSGSGGNRLRVDKNGNIIQ
jgi:hypothetical protein